MPNGLRAKRATFRALHEHGSRPSLQRVLEPLGHRVATTVRGMLSKILRPLSHSAADGALPTLFAATSPEAKPMGYYGPNGFYELNGPVAPAYVAPLAKDEALARKLWEVSDKLTGVEWPVHAKTV